MNSRIPSGEIDAIFEQPLLHLDTRADAWERWAALHDATIPPPGGMLFDQFASIIQAAIHGMGVALVPTYLVEHEIKEGLLVKLDGAKEVSIGSYFYVWPKNASEHLPSTLCHNWMGSMIEDVP